MRFLTAPCLLALLPWLAACHSGEPTAAASSPTGGKVAGQLPPLRIDEPQLYAGSDWVLYPLALPSTSRTEENEYGSSYSNNDPARYWQVLFYNARTGQVRQLVQGRKLLIHSIGNTHDEHEKPLAFDYAPSPYTSENLLLYSVATTDFNRDGRLDGDDPAYLFVSTKAGEHFRQVSPDSLHVSRWSFQPTTGRLLLTVMPDRNHDHLFTDADEAVPYVVDLAATQPATPVLPAALTRDLQRQRAGQWPPQP